MKTLTKTKANKVKNANNKYIDKKTNGAETNKMAIKRRPKKEINIKILNFWSFLLKLDSSSQLI